MGDGQRENATPAILPTKLRPSLPRTRDVSARLADQVAPNPGCLLLVHAAAGYGKTTALAVTQPAGGLWYNVDRSDGSPRALATRLATALGVTPPRPEVPAVGEALALELADGLQGRTLTITFDRFQLLGDAPEVGRLLSELLV